MRTHWDKLQIERAPFNPHLLWRRQNLSCFCSILQLCGGETWIFGVVKKRRLVIWVKTLKVVGFLVVWGKVYFLFHFNARVRLNSNSFSAKIWFFNNHNIWKTFRNITLTSCFLHNYHSSCTHFLWVFYIDVSPKTSPLFCLCSTIDQSLTFHEVECTYFFFAPFCNNNI